MQKPATGFDIYALSELAVTIVFGNEIADSTSARVNNLYQLLQQHPFPGFVSAVPAYVTLTVFYDPILLLRSALPGDDPFDKVRSFLNSIKDQTSGHVKSGSRKVTIPVCYGGHYGPDLGELAALHQLSVQEVIDLHSQAEYLVYMIGFVPGFAYLGGMNKQLETPRRATPRKAIPAGSVGIAGMQTGVYPLETPGGWQIIGRTPLRLFDAQRTEPALLQAGDRVVFQPVTKQEYEHYNHML